MISSVSRSSVPNATRSPKSTRRWSSLPHSGAQPAPLWGSEAHLREILGDHVDFSTLERGTLEITAFPRARGYAEHFKAKYGPTIAARKNAEKEGRAEEFDTALDRFCDEWDRGGPGAARFEKEYLIAVGTRA